ncbi:hypothetical protein SK41_01886 [Klebsiella aerogenes]|nr:hypothetical protein SK41_01886 [Klebsiella aerogenes]
MSIIVQPRFSVKILALETQRVADTIGVDLPFFSPYARLL